MEKQRKISILAKLALFTAALIWGSSFVLMKTTVDSVPPNLLLAIRFTIGCILLALVFHKKIGMINLDYLWRGAIIGLCLFLAYCSQTFGITETTPGKNAFLTAVYCVIVPFLFWAVDKKKPDIYNVVAAFICIAGIGLVSMTGGFSIERGDSLTLLGGFFYAAHIVAISKFARGRDPILISILQFGFAAVFAWILSLCTETFPTYWDGSMILSMLYLSILCTAVCLLLQNVGLKYVEPSSGSLILSLESVLGVVFSVILYNEPLTGRLICGFILIFIAVVISETKLSFLKGKNTLQDKQHHEAGNA